ncbi:hypothetical protein JTE90_010416 [Oedothorax gibbosus]|uniref:Uncharacterized protein n=1 Tax=Oedothorax gibbosus TaxID=931172 RepID=A0AAV6W5H4_9ARAC|nr:hypothetical protein JTE90_010416 [Oedothorax gibbosus]
MAQLAPDSMPTEMKVNWASSPGNTPKQDTSILAVAQIQRPTREPLPEIWTDTAANVAMQQPTKSSLELASSPALDSTSRCTVEHPYSMNKRADFGKLE